MDVTNVFRSTTTERFVTGRGETGPTPVIATDETDFGCVRGVRIKAEQFPVDRFIVVGDANVTLENGYVIHSGDVEDFPLDRSGKLFILGSEEGLGFSWWVI